MMRFILLLFLLFYNNVYAVVPSEDSSTGDILKKAFGDKYASCYLNFLSWSSDIPDENHSCQVNNAAIVTTAITTAIATAVIAGPFLGPAAAIATISTFISGFFTDAIETARQAKICRITPDSDDMQPVEYSDADIVQLLKRAGEEVTINKIEEKYNKICIEYKDSIFWLKQNECKLVHGKKFCAFSLMDSRDPNDENVSQIQSDNTDNTFIPEYLCVRVSSTCPCVMNLGLGTLNTPSYEKDKDGNYIFKPDGTLKLANKKGYEQYAARHCRALRQQVEMQRSIPFPYTGIIDDVCNNWAGYSKNGITLSAGVVQCFENSMRNLFEKPMLTSNSSVTLTSEQQKKYDQYVADREFVSSLVSNIFNITDGDGKVGYFMTNDLNILKSGVTNINNRTAFGNLTRDLYKSIPVPDLPDELSIMVDLSYNEQYRLLMSNIAKINDLMGQYTRNEEILKILKEQYKTSVDELPNLQIADLSQKMIDINNQIINTEAQLRALLDEINKITGGILGGEYIEQANNDIANMIAEQEDQIRSDFYARLGETKTGLTTLETEISKLEGVFLSQALSSNKVSITSFQSLQGLMQIVFIPIFVFYIMLIGYRIFSEEFSPNIINIIPIIFDIVIVYYFAMGSAWKDYFFNMILTASKGLGQFAMEITADYEAQTGTCSGFMNTYYIPKNPDEKCTFPNLSISASQDRYAQANVYRSLKTGNLIKGCIKGPFIPRPNYETPYIPVKYTGVINGTDGMTTQYLQVYCKHNNNRTTIPATMELNQITNEPTQLTCPKGYTMEDGYRASELTNMGFANFETIEAGEYGLISTAINILDENGVATNIIMPIVSDMERIKVSRRKMMRVIALEKIRSNDNKSKRDYPIIEKYNGVRRDMSYVGMFDTLDCKVMSYIGYNPHGNNDILFLKFLGAVFWAGPLGIAIWLVMLFSGFLIISMIGRVVQGYLVSIGAITILVYLSPLIMPCRLFSETKGFYNTWFNNIKKYATGIPVSLFVLGLATVFIDYVFYGSPFEYSYYNVFNDDGSFNPGCGTNDPKSAPLICLFNIMNSVLSTSSCLIGTCVQIHDNFWKYVGIMILKGLQAIIFLNILIDSLGRIETFINQMLGTEQDVSLSGSIFNTNTGLFSHIRARAMATMKMPIELSSDLFRKARTTVNDVKSQIGKQQAQQQQQK